jgi:integrase
MGRKASNVLAFNDQAARKTVRAAEGSPQKEWRVDGVDGLVLITQPSGAGVFYFFYRNNLGRNRKLRIGEFVPESEAARHKEGTRDEARPITLAEARLRAEKLRHRVRDGADPVAEAEVRASAVAFRTLAERFLLENQDIAATTRQVYRYTLEADVYPAIGDLPAGDVTGDHIVGICKRIEAKGARVQSDRTKATIGGVYRWGMRQRLVKANPCAGIGRRSPTVARTRAPTEAELANLWSAVEGQAGGISPAMRLIIKLAIVTGQRRTEVAGARLSELHGLEVGVPGSGVGRR